MSHVPSASRLARAASRASPIRPPPPAASSSVASPRRTRPAPAGASARSARQLDPLRIVVLAQRGGPPQQVRGRRHVAPGERAAPGVAELGAARRADLPALGVERAELRPVAERLLEVVAEDLLELLLAAALAVDALGPGDEPLVQLAPAPA